MAKVKGARRSFVIWFNALLLALLPVFEMAVSSLPQLREYLPDNVYKWVGLFVVVGNILLRFKTSQPLEQK